MKRKLCDGVKFHTNSYLNSGYKIDTEWYGMGTQNQQIRYLRAFIIACFGCLLIGYSLVYPIYYATSPSINYGYERKRYAGVKPYFGTVSENETDFYADIDANLDDPFYYYELTLEIRNFYTNNTPVTLILSTHFTNQTVPNFYNLTAEPINYEFQIWDPTQFYLIIQYNGSASAFSFWAIVHGELWLPTIPPPPIFPLALTGLSFVVGIILLVLGLYDYKVQKRSRHSYNLDRALIFCCLGLLLVTLSYPSIVRPHYTLYYHPQEYIDFGLFSGTVNQTVPRVNMTLWGINESVVEIRTFFVTNASVTIHAYPLDGSLNRTWNYVNSQYPGYQNFVFDTAGDTILEVERETEDTGFSCWVLVSFREKEIRQNYAGHYAPYATIFLVSGIFLLGLGLYSASKGFRELPKL